MRTGTGIKTRISTSTSTRTRTNTMTCQKDSFVLNALKKKVHHLDVEDEDWDEDWDGNKDEDKHEYKHKDKHNDLPERFLRTECTQKESPQPPLTLTSTSALTSTQYEDNYLYSLTPMPMNILCCGDVDIYVSQDEGIKASG